MKYFCWIKGRSCEFANARGWCEISACIKRGERMSREEIVRILDLALEQSRADACNGCAFSDTEEWEEPCKRCKRNYRDYWRRGKQND